MNRGGRSTFGRCFVARPRSSSRTDSRSEFRSDLREGSFGGRAGGRDGGVYVLEVAETKSAMVLRMAEERGYPLRSGVEKE